MEKIERRCPLCGSNCGELLYARQLRLPELLKFMPDLLHIVCCKNCGMIYTSSKATQDTYNLYYDTLHAYSTDKNTHGNAEDQYVTEVRETEFKLIENYIDHSYRIIDVGTGTGGMLQVFQKYGFQNLVGIDIDDKQEMIEGKGFQFLQGDIQSLSSFGFDSPIFSGRNLFFLSGVLEHIFDVRSAMLSLSDTMKNDDLLFVMVPDVNEYLSHFDRPYRYFGMEHINHFTAETLTALLGYYNFEILVCGKFDCRLNSINSDPALYALVKKKTISKDVNGREKTIAYIEKSKEVETNTVNLVLELVNNKKPVIVWGIGSYLMSLCEKTGLMEANIKFFVDNNESLQKSELNGIRVIAPKAIKSHPECCICVTSAAYSDNILDEISQMKLMNEVIIL